MNRNDIEIGKRVRSLVEFSGVPKGTEGIIDQDYGTGVMVAWDMPGRPLPKTYTRWDGRSAAASGILRDGFSYDELRYLEEVRR